MEKAILPFINNDAPSLDNPVLYSRSDRAGGVDYSSGSSTNLRGSGTGSSTDHSDTGRGSTDIESGQQYQGTGRGSSTEINDNTSSDRGTRDSDTDIPSDSTGVPSGESTLDSDKLASNIQDIYDKILGGGDLFTAGKDIVNLLSKLQDYFRNKLDGLNADEATQMASSVYNMLNDFLTTCYTNMYNRQNWVLENEYNSPVNQINRLLDAGINPAFYYGCLGNSQSGTISSAQNKTSQIAYTPQSQISDTLANVSQGVETAGTIAGVAMGAITLPSEISLNHANTALLTEQAETAKKMRPLQAMQYWSNNALSLAQVGKTYTETKGLNIQNDIAFGQANALKSQPSLQNKLLNAQTDAAISQKSLYNEQVNTQTWTQYQIKQMVDQGWEQIALGYDRINADLKMNRDQLAYSYYNTDVNSFNNLLGAVVDDFEEEKYFETDLLTNETREVGGDMSIGGSAGFDIPLIGGVNAKTSVSAFLKDSDSKQQGNKQYSRKKVTKHRYNAETMSQFFGGYLAFRKAAANGKVKMSPSQVATLNSNAMHIMDHAIDKADAHQRQSFLKTTIDYITGKRN